MWLCSALTECEDRHFPKSKLCFPLCPGRVTQAKCIFW